ncbi:MAG: hypothetical protein IJJ00_01640 [Erysipelotrichaceae bacterium]|nr:hypothetical protein [Erysipelotrichaceae bacterium]
MIKNLTETMSLLALTIICFFTLKVAVGWMFSLHRSGTLRGNFALFRNYSENEEE